MDTNMAKIDFRIDDTVAVVTLNSGENRFNPDFVTSYLKVLDEIDPGQVMQSDMARRLSMRAEPGGAP